MLSITFSKKRHEINGNFSNKGAQSFTVQLLGDSVRACMILKTQKQKVVCFVSLGIKEVKIVYWLFLVNCYLLHVPRLPSQPASNVGGLVIH